MSSRHDIFNDLRKVAPFSVSMGDKSTITAKGHGLIDLEFSASGKNRHCKLNSVLYVPSLAFNLMPVTAMEKGGCTVTFNNRR